MSIVMWFMFTMMMMMHRGTPPSTTPPITYINHYGYPCIETPYVNGDWLFIVQFNNDTDEDMVPTYGLIDFVVVDGTPFGIYINQEGCVLQ